MVSPPSRGPAAAVEAAIRLERRGFRLDVELTVAPGERLVLVGANGAGKSTVLRVLAGLEPAASARIRIGDLTVAGDHVRLPAHRRPIGLVFQDCLLFPHLSVRDNVAFGLTVRGVRRATARSRADDWLERFGLTEVADARPRQISGGQAQRVALARALAPGPALLLLDEPLAALDAATRMTVRAELREHLTADLTTRLPTDLRTGLPNEPGPGLDDAPAPAVIMVTHDPVDAAVIGQRMAVLEAGRIVQQGTPSEVARRPRSDYVARLMGLNLLPGLSDGSRLRCGDTTVHAAQPTGTAPGPGYAAFRPAAVSLHRERPHGSFRNVWLGTVVRVEPRGEAARVEVADAVGGRAVLAEVTQLAVADLGLVPGTAVWAAVKATDVELYPA